MRATHLNNLDTGLKPCPFCGGQVKLMPMPGARNWWKVRCDDFNCGGTTWAMQEPEKAAEAWNRRASCVTA